MKTSFQVLTLCAVALVASACNVKFDTTSSYSDDEPSTHVGPTSSCRLRTPIFLRDGDITRLYGATWTNVKLDEAIETETVDIQDRSEPKTLSFHEVFYRVGAGYKSSFRRPGARLDIGGSSIGFADVYAGILDLKIEDSTLNLDRMYRTTHTGPQVTTGERETTSLELLVEGSDIKGVALTVPVMRRNSGARESYYYTGRNQKLCVTDARD